MPQLDVSVNGRSYRIACGEGEEERVASLAAAIDAQARAVARGLTKSPADESRALLLAGIMVADELLEAQTRIDELEAQISGRGGGARRASASESRAPQNGAASRSDYDQLAAACAQLLNDAAAQMEEVTGALNKEG